MSKENATEWSLSRSIHRSLYYKKKRCKDIAQYTGLSATYVSSLRTGKTKSAKVSTLVEIAKSLDFDCLSDFIKMGENDVEIS